MLQGVTLGAGVSVSELAGMWEVKQTEEQIILLWFLFLIGRLVVQCTSLEDVLLQVTCYSEKCIMPVHVDTQTRPKNVLITIKEIFEITLML